jgi:hypothetical protein
MPANYPVAVFLYKRPKLVKILLDKVIDSGANKIYLFSDAGKTSQDKTQVSEVRLILKEYIHSYPQIRFIKHYSKKNLGLQHSIVGGVTKVLQTEKAAIFLEDDCMPHPDFFPFVREMLDKYKNEPKIMSVTGSGVGKHSESSYDFSKYQQCWGWATWARAWSQFDEQMIGIDTKKWQVKSRLIWPNFIMRYYWTTMLRLTKAGQVKSWAFRWSYAHLKRGGLAALPSGNLVSNVGFDTSATNTTTHSPLANMTTSSISFPLKHPNKVVENIQLSRNVEKCYYNNPIAILGMLRQLFYWKVRKHAYST